MQIDFFIYLTNELHQFAPFKITLSHYSTSKFVIFQYCILLCLYSCTVCFCVVRTFAYMLKNLSTSHETMRAYLNFASIMGHILVLCLNLVQTGFLAILSQSKSFNQIMVQNQNMSNNINFCSRSLNSQTESPPNFLINSLKSTIFGILISVKINTKTQRYSRFSI